MRKKLLKILFFTILVIVLLITGVCLLLEFRKPDIIAQVENWYNDNHPGRLDIGTFGISPFYEFPAITLDVKNVHLIDETNGKNRRQLQAKHIKMSFDFGKLLQKKFQLKTLVFKDADISVLIDSLVTKDPPPLNHPHPKQEMEWTEWLAEKPINVSFKNVDLSYIDQLKDKHHAGHLTDIQSRLTIKDQKISGVVTLDLVMDKMGFDTKKGTFFNTADVRGTLQPVFDLENQTLEVPEFELQIGSQDFFVGAILKFGKSGRYDIDLRNEGTDFLASKKLLSQDIQEKIEDYFLEKPFFTQTKIQGEFGLGSNPLVELDFRTTDNRAIILKEHSFDSLQFSGRLANRIYTDERKHLEGKKNFKIQFDRANGRYKGIPFELDNTFFRSTQRVKNYVQLNVKANGDATRLNEVLGNTDFIFLSGQFDLNGQFAGKINRFEEVFEFANSNLTVHTLRILYQPAKLLLPIQNIQLTTKDGHANIQDLRLKLPENKVITIQGNVQNFAHLVLKNNNKPVRSDIVLSSKQLSYPVLRRFIKPINKKLSNITSTPPDYTQLHKVMEMIYRNFHPTVQINIDEFAYDTYSATNLETNLAFEDSKTIVLNHSTFNYPGGRAKMDGTLKLQNDAEPLFFGQVNASGQADAFNELLDNNTFFFETGTYQLDMLYDGIFDVTDRFITDSQLDFSLADARIYQPLTHKSMQVDSLILNAKNNKAQLRQLKVNVKADEYVVVSGQLNNLGTLLLKSQNHPVDASLHVHSDHLSYQNLLDFLTSGKPKKRFAVAVAQPVKKDKNLSRIFKTIHEKFNPKLTITIDSFLKNGVFATDFNTEVYLNDAQKMVISKSGFKVEGGKAMFAGDMDYSHPEQFPSNFSFSANGKVQQFNQLFNNKTFIFEDGYFWADIIYNGDVLKTDSLIHYIDSDLTMSDVRVHYTDSDVRLPLKKVHVKIKDSDATVKTFDMPMPSGSLLQIDGVVENFNSVLIDDLPIGVNSNLNIYAADLDFSDLVRMFDTNASDENDADNTADSPPLQPTKTAQNVFKSTIKGIYHRFNPTLNVVIDDFNYRTFNVQDIKTGVFFHNEDVLDLKETNFNIGNTFVDLNALLDLSEDTTTYFQMDYYTENLEVERLVKVFDYFNLPSLRDAENVTGVFSSDGQLSGDFFDNSGKLDTTIQGVIAFTLEDLRMLHFKPILSTADKVFRDKRLKDIRFSPIDGTLNIRNGTIQIPQLNINSTAFNFFVEGDLRYDNNSHLWVSIPWSNLWFRNYEKLPKQRSFNESGIKFFIQALGNDNGGMDYKFRFTDKRWYKARGILELYKADKKRERKERRAYRKARRRQGRK